MTRHWAAVDVVDALRGAFGLTRSDLRMEEWAFLTEVPLRAPKDMYVGTPHENSWWTMNERYIDVLLVRAWSSKPHGHERLAIEVKVSRSDYRRETDEKRAPTEAAAHRCAYATPAGLIDPATLPAGWGLIEVYDDREAWAAGKGNVIGAHWRASDPVLCRWRVRAKRRDPVCDLDYLVAAVARRASRAEERARRAVAQDGAA